MEQDKKSVMKFIGLMIIYILLSALGIFSMMEVVLFPIVALPFAVYCMRNKLDVQLHIVFHIAVSIAIYLMMHSVLGVFIYLVSVVVPTYIILFLYKQKLPLPNMIMQGGLILAVVVFAYFLMMKGLGLDFEAQFGAALDTINHAFSSTIDKMMQVSSSQLMSQVELQEVQQLITQMKEMIATTIEMFKTFYASIIVSQVVMSFALVVIILNVILRRKNKELPHTGQILEFRVSKVAVLLLMLTMLLSDMNNTSGAVLVLVLNLMSFLASLFEIVGVLGLIALLRRTSINQGLKVLGNIGIVLLFMTSPYLIMFYGCLDAIFNYRKVDIVV